MKSHNKRELDIPVVFHCPSTGFKYYKIHHVNFFKWISQAFDPTESEILPDWLGISDILLICICIHAWEISISYLPESLAESLPEMRFYLRCIPEILPELCTQVLSFTCTVHLIFNLYIFYLHCIQICFTRAAYQRFSLSYIPEILSVLHIWIFT